MAMDIRAEELMLTIEATLLKVTENKIKETADYLKVPGIERVSRGALMRNTTKYNELQKDFLKIMSEHE